MNDYHMTKLSQDHIGRLRVQAEMSRLAAQAKLASTGAGSAKPRPGPRLSLDWILGRVPAQQR